MRWRFATTSGSTSSPPKRPSCSGSTPSCSTLERLLELDRADAAGLCTGMRRPLRARGPVLPPVRHLAGAAGGRQVKALQPSRGAGGHSGGKPHREALRRCSSPPRWWRRPRSSPPASAPPPGATARWRRCWGRALPPTAPRSPRQQAAKGTPLLSPLARRVAGAGVTDVAGPRPDRVRLPVALPHPDRVEEPRRETTDSSETPSAPEPSRPGRPDQTRGRDLTREPRLRTEPRRRPRRCRTSRRTSSRKDSSSRATSCSSANPLPNNVALLSGQRPNTVDQRRLHGLRVVPDQHASSTRGAWSRAPAASTRSKR